jgi:hypothetical protein
MRNRLLACLGFLVLALLTRCGGEQSGESGHPSDAGLPDAADAAPEDAVTVDGCARGASFCAAECADGGFWCAPHESCVALGSQGCPPMGCCRVDSEGYLVDCHN